MSESKVNCPNCGTSIDVNDILSHQLEEDLRKKYSSQFAEKNQEVEEKKIALEKKNLEFEEKKKKQNELFQDQLEKKAREQKEEIEERLKIKLKSEQEDYLKSIQKELSEKSEQIKELNKSKAEIEKLKRDKDELADKLKAENERKLNEQLNLEKEKIKKLAEEENKLKLLELQKQLDVQKKLTEDMKRKQEQGSMQLQGEVQELAIEDELRQLFPFDQIDEVSKGVRGADCLQTVINKSQEECGRIIYESKRTANFASDWIPKLKADMLSAGADVAVLITQTLPKDQNNFDLVEGVWVCSFNEFKSLALVLREGVIKVNATKDANENKGEKMQMLYDFLTGNEFKHQIEAIIGAFRTLEDDLSKEKRLMMKQWKKREKEIEKVIANTAGLYGSVKGIAGSSIQPIKELEFDEEEDEEDDKFLDEGETTDL